MQKISVILMCISLAACGGSSTSTPTFEPSEPVLNPLSSVAVAENEVIAPNPDIALTSVDMSMTDDFGSLINGVRLTAGSEIVTFDDRLGSAAQDYAQLMLDEGHFGHIGPDGSTFTERVAVTGYNYTSLRENIALGYRDTDSVFTAWQNSEGHRINNLAGDVDEFGLGFAEDGSSTRWVLILGSEG